MRKEILDSFPKPTKRNPDGVTADTTIADLLHYDDPMMIITECKFLWEDRYLEKGTTTRGGTFYNLTQKGIKARNTIYNPEWMKKIEKEMREAKENTIPKAWIGSKVSPNPFKTPQTSTSVSKPSHKKRDLTIVVSVIATIMVAFVFSPYFLDFVSPPSPEIHVTDLNAQDGIVEGNKFVYSYEPRSLIPNGTKTETFSLKISNTGNANANDFWIVMDSKPDGLWFDFQSSVIIDTGIRKDCQQKSSYCTIELIPKESNAIIIEYHVEFDHKLYQEIVDETPKLFFNYGFDEGKEQTIEIQLKFD